MLERDSARRPGARVSGGRLAWYGAAAALAGILAGGVAWLAYDHHKTAQELQAQHDLLSAAAPAAMLEPVLPPQAPPAPTAAPAVEAPRAAVVTDESARAREAPVASAPPPLIMLAPHEVAGAKPPAPAPRPVRQAAAPPKAVPSAQASKPGARPAPDKKNAEKAPKSPARAAKPAPARAAAAKSRPAAATGASRPRKASAGADAPVDSDVALISAIIRHAERHRGEGEPAGACKGPKCPAKPARP